MLPETAEFGPGFYEGVLRKVSGSVPILNHTVQQCVYQPTVIIYQPAEGLPVTSAGKSDVIQPVRIVNQSLCRLRISIHNEPDGYEGQSEYQPAASGCQTCFNPDNETYHERS